MSTKPPPVRIECAGGCGKHQLVRPSRMHGKWTYVGCGRCSGWEELRRRLMPVPDGMVLETSFYAAGGFEGMRLRIATSEERRSVERARAIRDAGIALAASRKGA